MFLNGHLDETLYMAQPEGFEDPDHPDWVCELLRLLYGLKQSPRQWNKELHIALLRLGLTWSKYDPTLYFKISDGELLGALTTHVNDLAIVGTSVFVSQVTSDLTTCFEVSANEELHHFLSLKITRDVSNRAVYVSQEHYVDELVGRFLDSPPVKVSTPTGNSFKDLCH